ADGQLGQVNRQQPGVLEAALEETAGDDGGAGLEGNVEAVEAELRRAPFGEREGELRADEAELEEREAQAAGERHRQLRVLAEPLAQLDVLDALQPDADLLQVDAEQAAVNRNPDHAAALALLVVELDVERAVAA